MKNIYILIISFFLLILFASCSKTIYFSQDMRNNLNKNHLNINKIQFYNSRKIILIRNLSYADTKVARGKIKLENGRYVENVIIPKKTPGVAIGEGSNYINVAFEDGVNRFLRFVLNDRNVYQISAGKWNQGYGKVKYDTLIYYIAPKSSKAVLKVKKDDQYNLHKSIRRLKGKTVGR